ncbi:YcaO-like family protein [Herbaspirillum autotrophicum]|uniref:YcaO-like family protein n=1 Tax=Herbaspirillum autotrophicum TaxID=180195 RepID=UPI00067AF33D|nr:YcaO-like family protein [Herbaspirillum autotrophicum]
MSEHLINEQFTRLSSSLRSRNVEESLAIAESLAISRGISRVVDTTWLDRIGIPVYSSIRPDGVKGTLCVHAGKGFTHTEAKIGAYMEAIEFSFATPGRNIVNWFLCKPADILASFQQRIHFSDFCPRIGQRIEHDDDIAVVAGEEIMSNLGRVLVPAELVYMPFFENTGAKLYGTSTNGLASGNTLEEATVHGLAEVMERHVRSFDVIKDRSSLVHLGNAPPKIKAMAKQIENAGLHCYLRYSENPFGLAYFTGYVLEPDEHNPIAVASGFGFHPIAEIAAVRALAEAVQGRLSHIHGGRDDIIKRVETATSLGRDRELDLIRHLRTIAANPSDEIDFLSVPNTEISSVIQARECLYEGLSRAQFNHVARVTMTDSEYPFQVVKIVVPGAEMYEAELPRIGPRLAKNFQQSKRHQHA